MDSIILNRISDGYIISAQSQASICTVNAVNIRSGYNSTSELLGNIIKLDHDYIFFKNVTAVYFKDDKFTDYNNTEIKPLEIVIHEDFADIEFSKYVKFNYYDNGVMHNTCELNMGEAFRQAIQTDLIRILGNPNLHISRGFYNEIGDSKRRISDVYPRTLIEMNLENYNNTEQRMSLSSVSEKLKRLKVVVARESEMFELGEIGLDGHVDVRDFYAEINKVYNSARSLNVYKREESSKNVLLGQFRNLIEKLHFKEDENCL